MDKIALLKKKYNKKTKKTEWALVSKSRPHRILRWFGARKPSKERVHEEEKRIQHFKHAAQNIIDEMRYVSNELKNKGIVHIADAIDNCTSYIVYDYPQDENATRISKVITLLQKKGEFNLSDQLDALLPDIISLKDVKINKLIEVDETEQGTKVSAFRAYNIVKLLKKKYVSGELSNEDFEYAKMKELETLLKTGFILSKPKNYANLPESSNNWWDHFENG
jgi:hypothetical protein